MSLKVLKAEYYDGEEHVYYIAACDMLSYLNSIAKVTNTSYNAGTESMPIRGMKNRVDWQKASNTLAGPPKQWISLAGTKIVKAPDSYYMNAEGIDTFGVRDKGGPSYNEFCGLLKSTGGTDAEIASWVRRILTGSMADAPEKYRAVPALAATLMLAEPRRNPRAFPINLMLLDFLEHNVRYGGKQDKNFSWDKILWRTGFGSARDELTKSYVYAEGIGTSQRGHERGGKLPMSNTSAVEQSQLAIPAHPPANTQFYFSNAEQEKEGTIMVRWLQHKLNSDHGRDFSTRSVAIPNVGATFAERARPQQTRPLSWMVTYTGLNLVSAPRFSYININQPPVGDDFYKKHFYESVRSALKWRNDCLEKPVRL